MPSNPQIFISAGEASGERYGALLMESVRAARPDAEFFGLGGAGMEAAGCERVVKAEDIAVMGITEVVRHLPRIYTEYRRLVKSIRARKPDVAVLIDFPDVNFRLARELRQQGVPVLYFVSPQIWAWKQYRVRWVRERVTKMLVIFPFEEKYYRERGVDAEFVGHPLADLRLPTVSREEFATEYGLDPSKYWVGLLPGSRARELRHNLPAMAAAANLLGESYEYLLPAAATLDPESVREIVAQNNLAQGGVHVPVRVLKDARAVLFHARASVVASGTATVEAALIGNPFVAVYRLSTLSYAVASRLVKLPHVAMANLIAGKRVVPELIQEEFTPEGVAGALRPLLEESEPRATMMRELTQVRVKLHRETEDGSVLGGAMWEVSGATPTAIGRAAEWVLRFLIGTRGGKAEVEPAEAPAEQ